MVSSHHNRCEDKLSDKSRVFIEDLRHGMLRGMNFALPGGSFADAGYMVDAPGMMWSVLNGRYGHFDRPTYSEIAKDFGVNSEHLRLTMLGKRPPSQAILDAFNYEKVVFYIPKRGAD